MKLYQRFIRIYFSDPFHKHVSCTDWMPEDAGMEFLKGCKDIESDDSGQGYCEGYWKHYHYDECFKPISGKPNDREDPEEVIGVGNADKMGNLIDKLTEALSK